MGTFNVSLKTLTERVSLEVVYTPKELDQINVEIAEVNRPGLFLAGYYDYFDKLRLQIMGLAEMNFLSGLSAEKRYEALEQLFRQQPPAVIVGRSEELEPFPETTFSTIYCFSYYMDNTLYINGNFNIYYYAV